MGHATASTAEDADFPDEARPGELPPATFRLNERAWDAAVNY